METIMKDIQVQPWWQYEDDITMLSLSAVKEAMNKELSQLLSKQSFKENDSRSLTAKQPQQVVTTRWVIRQRPTNNGTKDIKCLFCGKGFSQCIHDTDTQTFAATPSSMAMHLLLTIAIIKQFTVFTTDVANAFLNTPIDEEVIVQPPKEYYHNQPHTLWKMTKALYDLRTSPKKWQEHLSRILQKLGFTRLKSDACVCQQTIINLPHGLCRRLAGRGRPCGNTTVSSTASTTHRVETHYSVDKVSSWARQ
eukprot:5259249-Amphidinium_carterae.4